MKFQITSVAQAMLTVDFVFVFLVVILEEDDKQEKQEQESKSPLLTTCAPVRAFEADIADKLLA